MPDGDHGRIIQWLLRICLQHRPELFLDPNQGLKTEPHRNGRLRPDGSLVPCDAFVNDLTRSLSRTRARAVAFVRNATALRRS